MDENAPRETDKRPIRDETASAQEERAPRTGPERGAGEERELDESGASEAARVEPAPSAPSKGEAPAAQARHSARGEADELEADELERGDELDDDEIEDEELESGAQDDDDLYEDELEDDEDDESLDEDKPASSGFGRAEESEAAREASHQRRRLESTLRDVMRRAIERGVDAGLGALEQSVDVLERSVEAGRGSVKSANSRLRDVMEDVRIPDVRIPKELPKEFASLPKDVVNMLFTQLDEGKSVLVGAVAKEVREFLDETDVAYELQRVLTSISFEISTEIRFVPNERGVPRAEVSAKARPKVSSRRARKRKREDEDDE